MALGARLKEAMDARKVIPAELARLSGVDEATISATVLRDQKRSQYAVQFALALKVSLAWLLDGAGEMEDGNPAANESSPYVRIPMYDAGAGLGGGVHNDDDLVQVDGSYPLPRSLIERRGWRIPALKVMWTRGHSMAPNIKHGAPVVVNIDLRTFVDGEVFAIEDPEEGARIKRLHKTMNGRIRVTSDNPDKAQFPDDFLAEEDRARIIGMVVHRSGAP